MKSTKTTSLNHNQVIDRTLVTLRDLNRLTGHNAIGSLKGQENRLDQIILEATSRTREQLLVELADFIDRNALTLALGDQFSFDFDTDDLTDSTFADLAEFVKTCSPGNPDIGLKKLNLFRTYVDSKIQKILKHQDFEEARQAIFMQDDILIGQAFHEGLNDQMAQLGYKRKSFQPSNTVYYGLRMVEDHESDIDNRRDEFEDIFTATEYAEEIKRKIVKGLPPRATTYNLPTLEGIAVTPYINQTQGLAVLKFPVDDLKIWRHPADVDQADLQIFRSNLNRLVLPDYEVLIKDESFLSKSFLKSHGLLDVMALAARQPTVFQKYLARLTAKLDQLHIPYSYVDTRGRIRPVSDSHVVEPPKSSGKYTLDGGRVEVTPGPGNVVEVRFGGKSAGGS